jgi:glycosyltransferase involved in cell wall biosynthesis
VRILVATPWWPASADDPFGSFVRDQARALLAIGADVRVAVVRLAKPGARRLGSVARDAGDPRVSVVVGPWLPYRRGYDPLLSVWTRALARAIRREGRWARGAVALVHTQELAVPAARACGKAGMPFVLVAHGAEPDSPRYASPARLAAHRKALEAAARVVAVGPGLAERLRREAPAARVVSVLNGYDADLVARVASSPRATEATPRIASVSNLVEGKGVDLVVGALGARKRRGLPVPRYDVVGGGPLRADLEARAAREGVADAVRLHGAFPRAEALSVVRGATAFVLPSAPEACGIAYLEAMALGVPVVAVRGEGPTAFVRDGVDGFLVERGVEAVGRALDRLLGSPAEAAAMGCSAAQAASAHAWPSAARRLLDVLPPAPAAVPRPRRAPWIALYEEPTPYVQAKLDLLEKDGVPLRRTWARADASQAWGADAPCSEDQRLSSATRVGEVAAGLVARRYGGIHAGGWGGSIRTPLLLGAAWLGRLPLTIESDTHETPSRGVRAWARRAYLRWLDRRVRCWLPGGSPQESHLRSWVRPRAPVVVERMTTDTAGLLAEAERLGAGAGTAWRARFGIPEAASLLLYVGRVAPEKGVADLLQAARILHGEGRDVRVAVVGPGDVRPLLPPELPADRVVAPGRLPWRSLVGPYLAADVLVLPSRFEPWGLVVNEALLLGCPVVVTDAVGCARDLVEEPGAGRVVRSGDASDLARGIREVLDAGGRRSEHARRGRESMASWSLETAARRVSRALEGGVGRGEPVAC